MQRFALLCILATTAACGVPKSLVEAQSSVIDRLRSDSTVAQFQVVAVRDSLRAVEAWGVQSELASIELAKALEAREEALQLAQLRADSLQDRVLKNATQRDVWRLERLAAERAMLKSQRRADSLQEVILQLRSATKRR